MKRKAASECKRAAGVNGFVFEAMKAMVHRLYKTVLA